MTGNDAEECSGPRRGARHDVARRGRRRAGRATGGLEAAYKAGRAVSRAAVEQTQSGAGVTNL